ncbi:MAG: M1 family metallopeptidase [Rhizomicrobium sp.]
MRLRFALTLWAILAIVSAGTAAAAPGAPKGRLPTLAIPTHYSLTLTIDPKQAGFHGHDEISIVTAHPLTSIWLHGQGLSIERASVRLANGQTIAAHYQQVDPSGVALLRFAQSLPAGRATLLFDYRARFSHASNGLSRIVQKANAYAVSQFEADGARRMFPCFDEPGDKATFSLAINAPQGDVVITNSKVTSRNPTGGGMVHWVFATTPSIPPYLLNLDVGPFDVINMGYIPADKWRRYPLALRAIAPKGEAWQMRYALSFTPKLVLALERYFQIGFPFTKLDIIAAPDFAAGERENAGVITLRRRFLLMGPHAPLMQRRDSLLAQARELTQQWFGDLVTPLWWNDNAIKKAFAGWMSAKLSNWVMPEFALSRHTLDGGLKAMDRDQLPSARAINHRVNSVADATPVYDAGTRQKGAAILGMFENYVGTEPWQQAVHAFLLKYAGHTATQTDFIATIAAVTHHPELIQALRSYLNQPGIPDMSVVTRCSESPVLTVVQSMYAPVGLMVSDRQWQVPMCVSDGKAARRCRIIGRTADIHLGSICPAYVMPNALGLGYYRFTYDSRGWDRLLKAAPSLDAADQITLFANLQAALGAGQLDPRKFFEAVKVLAPSAKWDLIQLMRRTLRADRLNLLQPADMNAYETFIRKSFGRRLQRLTLRDFGSPSEILTRAALAQILIVEGHDPHTLAVLAKAARVYAASDGRNLGGLPPSLARLAMRAGVMVYGSAFANSLINGFLASPDDYFHRSVIYALMGSTDPNLLKGFFDLSLSPQMNTSDIRYLFTDASNQPVARAQLWSWYEGHYQSLVTRISGEGMLVVPSLFSNACSSDLKAQLADFLGPRAKTIPGLAHALTLAEQRIDQCISLRESKGRAIREALLAAAR